MAMPRMNEAGQRISGETYFFRDHGQFELLRRQLLPELIKRRRDTKVLRVWSAGCASGEEAYSLAMLVDTLLAERDDWQVSILGSDIDQTALAKARAGRYGQWSFRMVPAVWKQRYFKRQGGDWCLDERIRRMVDFRRVDMVAESFPNAALQNMDLILCRNVFIYFDADTVTAVANKLAAALSEGGYLMSGHAELSGYRLKYLQSRLFAESVVYQRLTAMVDLPRPVARVLPVPAPAEVSEVSEPPSTNVGELLAMAREYADRGQYDAAEHNCRQALSVEPLAAEPYFLLAQLAQLRGDFDQAAELLNKTLYLDPGCIAAALELAALCERAENPTKAQSLRRAALDMVRALPGEAAIEPYEMTAAQMAQWLMR